MEKKTEQYLKFERLISDLSARFINLSPDQVDREIENGLKEILEFFQVDRCGLIVASRDSASWQVTHATFAEGIDTVPVTTDLPVALFPWCYKKLVEQGEVVAFATLEELPAEAHIDKQTYGDWGVRSSVDIPISIDGNKHYILAIQAMRSERVWPAEYISRLRLLGEIFVNAIIRAQTRMQMDERMALARFHAGLSSRFVNVPPEQIDAEIDGSLQSIAKYLDIDRATLNQLSDDASHMIVTHSWAAPGYATAVGVIASAEMPWISQKVIRGETVVCSCVDDLPAEAARDKKFLKEAGSQSNISIPLMSGGKVLGFVGLGSLRRHRNWPEKMVRELRSVLQIFANALARKRADQALRESEVRLNLAAASANAGLWVVNFSTGHVWLTEKTRELFGFAPDKEMTFDIFLTMVHPEDRECVQQTVQQAIESKDNISVEYQVVFPDGSIRWMSSQGKAYFRQSGEPDHLTGVTLDITGRKQMEKSLQEAYAEIKKMKEQLEAENIYLRKEAGESFEFQHIIGKSAVLRDAIRQVEQVAATDSTVLLTGETGTGKELIAQAIHNLSNRHSRLMVKINCAALPAGLIESELFGRERGAYTGALTKQIGRFELADRSTLFLDEITELPLDLQAKLLRVLQDGEFERLGRPNSIRVDVRLIAATNRDIDEEVRRGRLREDLYYRLKVFPIGVPPLRERPEDIPLLVQAFITEFSEKMGKKIQTVPKKTMEALQRYYWPGNIRELRNVIEHAVIISNGSSLQLNLPQNPGNASFKNQTLEETEYQHITEVLSKTGWRIKGPKGAAELLGMKPSTLYTRMNKLGIPNRREKTA